MARTEMTKSIVERAKQIIRDISYPEDLRMSEIEEICKAVIDFAEALQPFVGADKQPWDAQHWILQDHAKRNCRLVPIETVDKLAKICAKHGVKAGDVG